MLLFGVAIFSYCMNNFVDLVTEYKFYVGEFDEGDELNKFFGTMKKFNNNNHIETNLKEKIESYFSYRWASFKN